MKRLLYSILTLLVFTPALYCQQEELPDTPSATQATACTEKDGKPCPEWLHKLIGQYPPDPAPRLYWFRENPVHFWTYRSSWQDPPLRTNREVFRSKLFVGLHLAGAVAMVTACMRKGSGESWGSEAPAVAALFGMDYLQFRFIGGPNAVGAPIYQMIHYSLSMARAHP
jgi:hypothetical protein